jgi:hypothetical protein
MVMDQEVITRKYSMLLVDQLEVILEWFNNFKTFDQLV